MSKNLFVRKYRNDFENPSECWETIQKLKLWYNDTNKILFLLKGRFTNINLDTIQDALENNSVIKF